MADTVRTVAALQALLADNTAGDISAQDVRDFLVSAYQPAGVLPGGRLTTESGVPVSTSDRTAQGTLYYTPYAHNRIALYDGTSWAWYSFTERSLALSSLTSGLNYDVFLWDNSGTLTLELTGWTNDTTRATALTTQDGVLVRSGATTRRYLGTIRTTGTATTEDSRGGTTSNVGGRRFVWNAYNQVLRPLSVIDTTDSWTYAVNSWRQARATAGNQVEFVLGLAGGAVSATVNGVTYLDANSEQGSVAVGLDSTTAPTGLFGQGFTLAGTAGPISSQTASYLGAPAAGYHYLAWIERAWAGTVQFNGDDGGKCQAGLIAGVWG